MKDKLVITPRTKVYDLLEAYPELEEKLIELVPAFEKLRNPILRRTITRVTTIGQAASIGNVSVERLVNQLRNLVGQDEGVFREVRNEVKNKPQWVFELPIGGELDVRPILESGEHPVGQVIADLQKLEKGKQYRLVAPFLPVPLIDKAIGIGFEHWAEKINDNEFHIYFKH